MKPVQVCASQKYDTKADVWSLGAMLYTMLTGLYVVSNQAEIGALIGAH